jgi:hypothetical protein
MHAWHRGNIPTREISAVAVLFSLLRNEAELFIKRKKLN